ncbi:MAG: TetR/AcrR family transcriptional regulator [Pseudonocardiaceae bacterium]
MIDSNEAPQADASTVPAATRCTPEWRSGQHRQAGVGVGTVYRCFGDRAGLAYELLDDDEQQFQAAFLFGPPPLGPGASPIARIRAFLHAYVDRLDTHASLLALAEAHSPTARYGSGAYRTHRTHLVTLLAGADPNAETVYLAEALLAVIGAGLYLHQRQDLQFSPHRIKTGLDQLLAGLVPADADVQSWPTCIDSG